MQEPFWIGEKSVLAIHERQLAEFGGLSGLRDEGLLAPALARPQNRFFYGESDMDFATLAAAYAYGLTSNHPFSDGNKRTTPVVGFLFLAKNGYALSSTESDNYTAIYNLAPRK